MRAPIDLDETIERAHELPPLPQSACRLATLLAGDDYEIDDVAEVVRLDPVLSARILRLANSSANAGVQEVSDIPLAILRAGPAEVLGVAVGAAAQKSLDAPLDAYGLSEGALWRHSVAAALATQQMKRLRVRAVPAEAFAAALLHDIGLFVLSRQMTPELIDLVRRSRTEGGRGTTAAEVEILGTHHGEVGGMVAQTWGLPDSMVAGISFHHSPEEAPTERCREVARCVALADAVAVAIGEGTGDVGVHVLAELDHGIEGADELERLCASVSEELDDVLAKYE